MLVGSDDELVIIVQIALPDLTHAREHLFAPAHLREVHSENRFGRSFVDVLTAWAAAPGISPGQGRSFDSDAGCQMDGCVCHVFIETRSSAAPGTCTLVSTMNPIAAILAVGLATSSLGPLFAQELSDQDTPDAQPAPEIFERARLLPRPTWDDPIRYEVSPRFHYIGAGGGFFLNGSARVPADFAKIDDPRVTPGWHASAAKGRYRLETEGFVFRTAGREVRVSNFVPNVPPATLSRTELELTTAELRLGYDLVNRRFANADGTGEAFRIRLTPRAGLRLIDLKLSVEQAGNPAVRDSTAVTLVEPIVGISTAMVFEERFEAGVSVDIGTLPKIGDVDSASGSIAADIGYRLNENWSLRGGYRLLIQDVGNEDLEFDGSVAGVYLGFSVRF